ncbi:MAG TPA: AAA family ATPase [Frankiaceae bacterium]|nr:AAA family ATPase [Frankiaceae bacterium]
MTPQLLLLNGPPGIGKSTIAARYVAEHPLALRLDVDELRRGLGRWEAHDHAAGLLARDLALAMAGTHLAAGHDVVVAQYLARPAFADALGAVAAESGAAFAEVVLMDGKQNALARFAARATDPALAAHHREAAARAGDTLPAMYDALVAFAAARAHVLVVPTRYGDIDGTYRALLTALGA